MLFLQAKAGILLGGFPVFAWGIAGETVLVGHVLFCNELMGVFPLQLCLSGGTE